METKISFFKRIRTNNYVKIFLFSVLALILSYLIILLLDRIKEIFGE
jgi:hypothetical protein